VSIRIGINGFGRMGRLALRAAWGNPRFEWVLINELRGGPETSAHLLRFDSVHGRWNRETAAIENRLLVDGTAIPHSSAPTIEEGRWGAAGCDIVLECTGKFRHPGQLQAYFDQGVKKVIVAAPVKEVALNVVVGVNDHLYDPARHHLLTAASCTTNCLAPVVKVLQEKVGIEHGMITTIHDVTNTQTVVDLAHKDLRRARSSLLNLIPTSTGSATAITMIYPELKGKLNGLAVRVPLLNASITDCVFEVKRQVSVSEVNGWFEDAANNNLKGILAFEQRPLVSTDFINDPHSATIDGPSTMVVDGTQLKILAWYDNEWGYVNRIVELADTVAGHL